MTVTSATEPGPRNARAAILAAARTEIAETGEISLKGVAARAGVTRQTIAYHFGGARGLRAALVAEGLAEREPDEPTAERLIAAAAHVLSQPGAGVVSIDAIAAEAGLTKGAFYHHFADRAELLRAVARRVTPVDAILAVLHETADLPLREGLIGLTTTYYREMGARIELIRNLGANASRDPELSETVMAEVLGRALPVAFEWFGRRIERGEIRAVDVSFVMQALFGPLFLKVVFGESVFDRIATLGVRPAVSNVEAYVDFLLDGIRGGVGDAASSGRSGVSSQSAEVH